MKAAPVSDVTAATTPHPNTWHRVKAIFEVAIELVHVERESYLDKACQGEPELRACLDALLEVDETTSHWLRHGVARGVHRTMASPTSRDLGSYRLLEEIGRGGMGTVFRAERRDGAFDQVVAVKVISTGRFDAALQRRFLAERQILAQLAHPHIARLLDGGATDDGVPFLVMEYVEGKEIRQHCRDRRLGVDDQIALVLQVCDAVSAAHQRLVIHRDLKPGNLLVDAEGNVKLLDFGVAKLLAPGDGAEALTRTAGVPCTPAYASPEQILGQPVTTASDVYSLGVVLYEILTGERPHDRSGAAAQVITKVSQESLPEGPGRRLERLRRQGRADDGQDHPGASDRPRPDLDPIVLKAMDPDPARRYASVEAMAADLRRYLRHEPVTAAPASVVYRLRKAMRRHRGAVLAAALVVLSLVAGLVARSVEADKAKQAAATAEEERLAAQEERLAAQEVSDFLARMLKSADPMDQGRDVRVVDLLEAAAAGLATDFQDRPQVRGTLHLTLARTYDNLSMWNEAEEQYLEAIEVDRTHRGPLAASTVEATLRLGGIYNQQERFQEAAALAEPLWRQLRQEVGMADFRTLDAQLLWGHCLDWLGRTDESIAVLEDVAQWVEAHFPDDPGMPFTPWTDIGVVYRNANRPIEAEAHLRRILDLAHQRLEPDHPLATRIQNLLGKVLEDQGRHAEAEALLRDLVDRLRTAGAERELDLGNRLATLGISLENQGRLDEAETIYREALEITSRIVGPNSHEALYPRQNILDVMHRQRRYADALDLAEIWAPELDALVGPTSSWVVIERARRASLKVRLGHLDDAEALLDETAEHLDSADREPDAHALSLYRAARGLLLLHRGQPTEAESLMRSAYDDLLALGGGYWVYTHKLRDDLVELYDALDQPEKAAALARHLTSSQEDGLKKSVSS